MKLTAQIKLQPTPAQSATLLVTLERANAACNAISAVAWATQTFSQFPLHRLVYQRIRAEFELSAQMTVRCLAKVTDAYKHTHARQHRFKPRGGIAYDDRLLNRGAWRSLCAATYVPQISRAERSTRATADAQCPPAFGR